MKRDTEARRSELLKLEGQGLLKPEIVKELSMNYKVSFQTCYNDFNNRAVWQPKLLEMERAVHRVLNRHEQLYRKASLSYMQAGSTREKQNAIAMMRVINADLFHMLQSSGYITLTPAQIKDIILGWQNEHPIPDDSIQST